MKVFLLSFFFLLVISCISYSKTSTDERQQTIDFIIKSAKAKYTAHDYRGAIVAYSRAISMDTANGSLYFGRGSAFARCGYSDSAIRDYKKSLKLEPGSIKILDYLGWEYLHKGMYAESEKCFNACQVREPGDPDVLLGLALVYYQSGSQENSRVFLEGLKKIRPSFNMGYLGVTDLEITGCYYTEKDHLLLKQMFGDPHYATNNFKDFFLSFQPELFIGFLLFIFGVAVLLVFLSRLKKPEFYLLYLSLFILGYSVVVTENQMIILSFGSTPVLDYIRSIIKDVNPMFFILFLRYYYGSWGWKNSILWLFLLSAGYALTGIVTGIVFSNPGYLTGSLFSNIFIMLIILVLTPNLFLSGIKRNKESLVIGAGLGFFVVVVLYNNLSILNWFNPNVLFERFALLVFICCLVYVAVRRSNKNELQYQAVWRDLETAGKIQRAILPQHSPATLASAIYQTYIPMTLIGGDFYDFHVVDDNRVGILVADVSGHGISAALIASMIKVAFNSQVHNAMNPALLIAGMNQALSGQLNDEFITAAYLCFDFSRKTLHFSSAGNPYPVILRASANKPEELKVQGVPIGIAQHAFYAEASVNIAPGDRILLYTDGLVEIFSQRGELYGKNRLLSAFTEKRSLSQEKLATFLLDNVTRWSGKKENASFDDDITFILVDLL